MALTKCYECGNSISTSATSCPYSGARQSCGSCYWLRSFPHGDDDYYQCMKSGEYFGDDTRHRCDNYKYDDSDDSYWG